MKNTLRFSKERIVLINIILSILLILADYFSGPFIQFPFAYLIPVALISWYFGLWWGISLSVLLSLIRLGFNIFSWDIPWSFMEAIINACIRIIVFSSFAVALDRISQQHRELSKRVKTLEGLLPICSFCKKIRDEKGNWQVMERYISNHSTAEFTHGFCPDCIKEHYGKS